MRGRLAGGVEALEDRLMLSAATGKAYDAKLRAAVEAFFKQAPVLSKAYGGRAEALLDEGIRPVEWKGRQALVKDGEWVVKLEVPAGRAGVKLNTARQRLEDFRARASRGMKRVASASLAQVAVAQSLGGGMFVMRGPADLGQVDAASLLGGVAAPGAAVEPNFVLWADAVPTDPSFGQLWGMNNTGQSGGKADADIDGPEGWELSTGSSSVVVGIIDTGIDYSHPDLAANVWTNPGEVAGNGVDDDGNGYVDDVRGWDFANNDADPMDDNRHGTHVAGTIGAVGNNGQGVAGVSQNVKMMGLKFLSASGTGSTAGAIAAVNYATMMRRDFGVNIRLTNNSWGGGGFSTALRDAIAAQQAQGMLFVAAAGNDSSNTDASASYPASYDLPNIVSVASTDRNDALSYFSNYGKTTVDLAAPGSEIYSTLPGGSYGVLSGTSMATPHVTGALAVLQAVAPGLTGDQIKQRLLQRVDKVAALKDKVATGGRLNLFNLLDPSWVPAPASLELAAVAFGDAGGNNDNAPNPGEKVTLTPSVYNSGQADATGVTVEIVPPAGATIVGSATQSVANVPAAGTTATPVGFQVQLASNLTDGAKLTFQFVVRYDGTQQKTLTHQITIAKPNPQSQVATGWSVGEMQADRTRNLVYVLDQTNNKVVAIDTDLGRTVAHADVGSAPSGLAVSVDGSELYVSSSAGNKVVVFSLPDLVPLRTLTVPTPGLMAAGAGNMLYVAGLGQWGALRQVDARTGEVRGSFGSYYSPLPRTNAAGTRLYVSELGLSTTGTTEYDSSSPTGVPVQTKSHSTNMANGRDAQVDEEYNRLYAMSGGVYGVSVVNMAAGTTATWSFGGAAYGTSVSVNADVPFVYAGSQDSSSGGVFKYDRATGAVLGSYKPTGSYKTVWEVELTRNGNVLYKADPTYSLNPATYQIGIIGRSSLVVASVPNARFVASQVVTSPGLTVGFDGTVSKDYEANGTIASYAWDFGDGTAAGAGSKVDHTFATPGTYSVKLTVVDGQGYNDEFIGVVKVSNPPVAKPVAVVTNEDVAAPITLDAADPDLDPLTYVIVAQPAHGMLTVNGADVTYTPAANYFGADSFTYKANDGRVDGNVATVSITVNAVNDAPTAVKDVLPLAAGGGATTVNPMANDFDVEGDAFSITSFTQPARGAVTLSGGVFTYTPAKAYQGFDTFTYTVTDAKGASSTAEVAVASGVAVLDGGWSTYGNDAARTGYFPGFLGSAEPIDGWVLDAGFGSGRPVTVGGGKVFVSDHNGSTEWLKVVDPSTGATLWTRTMTANDQLGQASYWNGRVYVQMGNHSGSKLQALDAATGAVIWESPYQAQWDMWYAPAVNDQAVWIGGGYYGGMYGFRHDGSQIAFLSQAQVDEWAPSILGDSVYALVSGKFSKYSMNGSPQWSVTLTGSSPVAALAGGRAFVNGTTNLYGINLTNGSTAWSVNGNFAGSPAVAGGVVYAISGMTVKAYSAADGTAVRTYTADQNLIEQPLVTDDAVFVASAGKTYVFDRATGVLKFTLAKGGDLSLANNRLYVAASDGSVATYLFARSDNDAPVANPDAATTAEETAVVVDVVANDTDANADPVKLRAVGAPGHGSATIEGAKVRYVPEKDFFGTDTFTYTVVDEKGGKTVGTATITVTPLDDAPVAKPATVYVPTTGPSPITLGGTDVDGDPLTFQVTDQPLYGTLTAGPTADAITYNPKAGFTGSDSFYYRVNDGNIDSAKALVVVYVDDAPTATDVAALAREDVASTIALQGTDPNDDPLVFKVVSGPTNGTATVSGRYLTYTPKKDFFGTDTITYRVNDGIMDGNTATLTITVQNGNDGPVAVADSFPAAAGQPVLSPDVLKNDTDADADALGVTGFTQPQNGTVKYAGGGRFAYTPNAGYAGLDWFRYTVGDGSGDASTATVTVSVGTASLAGEWATHGNGAAHTGYFAGSILGGTLVPEWSNAAAASGRTIATGGGRVYSVSGMTLRALYPVTGNELWSYVFPAGYSLNAPTYWKGRLYLQRGNHSSDTQLFAIDAANGNKIWQASFGAQWESYYAPAVDDNGIWINGGSYGGMYGFRHDGTQIKFVSQPQYDDWTPSILDGSVYAYVAGNLSKYTADGTPVWTHTKPWSWSGWSMNMVSALSNGRGFVNGQPNLYAVNLADGSTAWSVPGTFTGSPAAAGGRVYAISGQAVNAYDALTGALVQTYTADASLAVQQPVVTDDGLFVSSGLYTYVFDLASGTLVQKLDQGGQLAVANDTLYISSWNTGTGAGLWTYTLGAPAAAPGVPDLTDASDTGVVGDDATGDATPTFVGTAPAEANVLLLSDGVVVGSGVADGTGTWSITSAAMADGTHAITAAVVDAGGGSGRLSGGLTISVDAAAPTATGAFDRGTPVIADPTRYVSVRFSKDVSSSLTLADVHVRNLTTGAELAPASLVYDKASNTAVIGLGAAILADGNYEFTIDHAGVTDGAGNRVCAGPGCATTVAGDVAVEFFWLTGDVNQDRKVDEADRRLVEASLGATGIRPQDGDADGDRQVDFNDLVVLAQNYNRAGTGQSTGDFTGDGRTAFDDLVVLAQNYNRGGRGDINLDGVIDQADLDAVNGQWGRTLPPAPPDTAGAAYAGVFGRVRVVEG